MSVQNRSKYGSTMKSTQSTFQTSLYATPFILDRDISNKYKVNHKNVSTQGQNNTIPFLRAPSAEWKAAVGSPRTRSIDQGQTYSQGFNKSGAAASVHSRGSNNSVNITRRRLKEVRRENGWDSYIKPISKYNE